MNQKNGLLIFKFDAHEMIDVIDQKKNTGSIIKSLY